MTIVNIKQQVQTDECQRAGLSACKFEGNGGDSRRLERAQKQNNDGFISSHMQ